jgi:hypothetical protein
MCNYVWTNAVNDVRDIAETATLSVLAPAAVGGQLLSHSDKVTYGRFWSKPEAMTSNLR